MTTWRRFRWVLVAVGMALWIVGLVYFGLQAYGN